MRSFAFRLAAPLLLLTTLGAARPAAPAHFSMILTRDGRTWSATCENGCDFGKVSVTLEDSYGGDVVVDATGIRTRGTESGHSSAYAFELSSSGDRGWEATAIRGTAWITLASTCGEPRVCRTRVTETGATRLP